MGTKNLTLSQKAKWTPNMYDQYYQGCEDPFCIYCKQEFIEGDPDYCKEWEHLNNKEDDNRPENLGWAHAICNERKKHNPEFQVMAAEYLKKNIRRSESLSVGESERAKTAHTQAQPNEQIDANADSIAECEKYLTEMLLPPATGKPPAHTKLDWNDTEDALAFKCYRKFKHGSQKTIRYYLKMLTSGPAPFDKFEENGRTYIVRRTGN